MDKRDILATAMVCKFMYVRLKDRIDPRCAFEYRLRGNDMFTAPNCPKWRSFECQWRTKPVFEFQLFVLVQCSGFVILDSNRLPCTFQDLFKVMVGSGSLCRAYVEKFLGIDAKILRLAGVTPVRSQAKYHVYTPTYTQDDVARVCLATYSDFNSFVRARVKAYYDGCLRLIDAATHDIFRIGKCQVEHPMHWRPSNNVCIAPIGLY